MNNMVLEGKEVVKLILTIDNCLNNGLMHAVLLDFSKAFDKVAHKSFVTRKLSPQLWHSVGMDNRLLIKQNTNSISEQGNK